MRTRTFDVMFPDSLMKLCVHDENQDVNQKLSGRRKMTTTTSMASITGAAQIVGSGRGVRSPM